MDKYGRLIYRKETYYPIPYWARFYAVHHTKIRQDVLSGKIETLELNNVYDTIKAACSGDVELPEDFAKNTIWISESEARKILESTQMKNREKAIRDAANLRSSADLSKTDDSVPEPKEQIEKPIDLSEVEL
jgi:hypothetical protein